MAKRESQGIQIALILLISLSVILCISTYFFWSQSQKLGKEAASAAERATTADNNLRLKIEENQKFKQFLGYDPNTEAAEIERGHAEDMALYGQSVPEGERNYRKLPQQLVLGLQERNKLISELRASEAQLKQAVEKIRQEEQQRAREATAGHQQAGQDLASERAAFQKSVQDLTTRVQEIERRHGETASRLNAEKTELTSKLTQATNDLQTLRSKHEELKETLRKLQLRTFEYPDGEITYVNQSARTVYLNIGRADSLQRQTSFSVYDVDENNLARAEPKGKIEVTKILGDHLSEAAILEDSVTDPIISGDAIYSPVWQAGRPVHFALAGKMDVDRDGVDDLELVKNLITLNGGVVDAVVDANGNRSGELSVETRYLVIGERPTERSAGQNLEEFARIREESGTYGVTEITLNRFLADMGYQAVARSVSLGSSSRESDLRPSEQPISTGRYRPRTPPRPRSGIHE